MRLATFAHAPDAPDRVGALVAGGMLDLTAALPEVVPGDLKRLIADGDGALAAVGAAVADPPSRHVLDLDGLVLRAPIPRPGKLVGVGLNYAEHVDESSRTLDTSADLPTRPVLFDKPGTAVVGPDAPILHDHRLTAQLDWEAELAVVIGRAARRVRAQDALGHVFGYSVVNDVSARDQRRSGQWFFSKGQDSFAPFGPWLVTADEIDDPHDLRIGLRVNGVSKQDSSTRHMLFRIPQLIADISSGMTLEPGDVIATGSPPGVGAGRTPPEFLRPGDVVEAEVERIGILRNPVVDATVGAGAQ
jgi:2-keto-4-pentenoate hydratase/2-oxohepta-3-ene-1,7-dioic acid hydratase in catechol pathway